MSSEVGLDFNISGTGCKSFRMMAWLSGSRCRFAYGSADATATHNLLLQIIQIGFTFLVLAHPGSIIDFPRPRVDL